jgi:uroporphyrinogen-III decarboxylase
MCDALGNATPRGVHLCGDATRHFATHRDELNIRSFDTGFPVDFGAIRRALGPDIRIQGGPHVDLVLRATPDEVYAECRRILQTGIADGPFVLREGNNLAPHTPPENVAAMYRAGRYPTR